MASICCPASRCCMPLRQVGSFLQAFGGAARSGIILLTLRSCAGHIFLGLAQAIERLLACGCRLRPEPLGVPFAPCWPFAPDWPLCDCPPCWPLPCCPPCCPPADFPVDCPVAAAGCAPSAPSGAAVPRPRGATSPAASAARKLWIARALLLRQFLLAARQLVELLQRVVDFLVALVGRRWPSARSRTDSSPYRVRDRRGWRDRGPLPPSATASASRSEGHLNLAERGFGAQQVLQRFLFVGQRVVPLLLLQFIGGGSHGRGCRAHILLKVAELLVLRRSARGVAGVRPERRA